MSTGLREHFNLSQQLLADWLGVHRTTLALAERGHRDFPGGSGVQEARLQLARLGQVLQAGGQARPAPPALPVPAPDLAPLRERLAAAEHRMRSLSYALRKLRQQAAPYEARLAAAPALRASAPLSTQPALDDTWLNLFEGQALAALRDDCGAGPQLLLEARLAGLAREAELLQAALVALPPAA